MFSDFQIVYGLIARAEIDEGRVRVVNAGHPPPYLLRGGGLRQLELRVQLPMGLFGGTRYEEQEFVLEPGDRLFLFSDGVTDAGPPGEEHFGETRLQGLLLATADQPPHEAVRHVLRTVTSYQQGNFRDDATALCLDWHGRPDHA